MTLSALEQLKSYKNYHISKEVWYNKFPYRLSLLGHWITSEELEKLGTDNSKVRMIHRQIRAFFKKQATAVEYKIRSSDSFCVYLKTAEDVVTLLRVVDPVFVREIKGPISEKQESIMLSDMNVLVKQSLYYKKYRYKIDVIKYRDHAGFLLELKDFVVTNFEVGSYKFNQAFSNYELATSKPRINVNLGILPGKTILASIPYNGPWRYHGSIYLKNYEDLCTLHMMYKKEINKTTKIVTTSEV